MTALHTFYYVLTDFYNQLEHNLLQKVIAIVIILPAIIVGVIEVYRIYDQSEWSVSRKNLFATLIFVCMVFYCLLAMLQCKSSVAEYKENIVLSHKKDSLEAYYRNFAMADSTYPILLFSSTTLSPIDKNTYTASFLGTIDLSICTIGKFPLRDVEVSFMGLTGSEYRNNLDRFLSQQYMEYHKVVGRDINPGIFQRILLGTITPTDTEEHFYSFIPSQSFMNGQGIMKIDFTISWHSGKLHYIISLKSCRDEGNSIKPTYTVSIVDIDIKPLNLNPKELYRGHEDLFSQASDTCIFPHESSK